MKAANTNKRGPIYHSYGIIILHGGNYNPTMVRSPNRGVVLNEVVECGCEAVRGRMKETIGWTGGWLLAGGNASMSRQAFYLARMTRFSRHHLHKPHCLRSPLKLLVIDDGFCFPFTF